MFVCFPAETALLHLFFFFFQAEDGIRDLVRSRGLGDVYKRQARMLALPRPAPLIELPDAIGTTVKVKPVPQYRADGNAVSYTHLTLPTSDLV